MYRILYCLLFVFTLIFASCEDKESSVKKEPKEISEKAKKAQRSRDSLQRVQDSILKARKESARENAKIRNNPDFPLAQEELIPYLTKYGAENPETRVRITTRYGEIDVLLYRDTPLHRANFIMLVKNGYFNETFFHRVAPGFVIQGGNSDNPSTSSKRNKVGSYLIPSEFEAGHRHSRGAFSAAKFAEQNVSKASSPFEFFIVLDTNTSAHLNNDHTVFGRVIKGMDVVDKISEAKTGQSEWPVSNIQMEIEVIE